MRWEELLSFTLLCFKIMGWGCKLVRKRNLLFHVEFSKVKVYKVYRCI